MMLMMSMMMYKQDMGRIALSVPVQKRNKDIPHFLQNNPDIYDSFQKYCSDNLDTLSSESIYEWFIDTVIPQTVMQINNEQDPSNPDKITSTILLHQSGLTTLCLTTVRSWMKQLGFKWEPKKKTYYTDNHERPSNVIYRNHFIGRFRL